MKELIKLFQFGVILVVLLLSSYQEVSADCQGCCSYHGGVVCTNGVTMCADGDPLSQTCLNKGCNVCPPPTSCDSNNLNLCVTQNNCEGAGGYWCDGACQNEQCLSCERVGWLGRFGRTVPDARSE